jgi:hypothetical protein
MTVKIALVIVAALIAVAVLLDLPDAADQFKWLAVGLLVADVAIVAP